MDFFIPPKNKKYLFWCVPGFPRVHPVFLRNYFSWSKRRKNTKKIYSNALKNGEFFGIFRLILKWKFKLFCFCVPGFFKNRVRCQNPIFLNDLSLFPGLLRYWNIVVSINYFLNQEFFCSRHTPCFVEKCVISVTINHFQIIFGT